MHGGSDAAETEPREKSSHFPHQTPLGSPTGGEAAEMAVGEDEGWRRSGIEVSALQFDYDGQPPLFARFNLRIAPGSRCLLIGANGSG